MDSKTIWLLVKRTRNEFEMVCLETLLKGLYILHLRQFLYEHFKKRCKELVGPRSLLKNSHFLEIKAKIKSCLIPPWERKRYIGPACITTGLQAAI